MQEIFRQVIGTNSKNVLFATNNSPISTYGTKLLCLDLNLRRTFKWVFIVSDVNKPIIGADFLGHDHFLSDIQHRKLVDASTQISTNCDTPNITTVANTSPVIKFQWMMRTFLKR